MVSKQFLLEGLDCANCAAKIERDVNGLNGVTASVNFATKTLSMQIEEDSSVQALIVDATKIVNKYEPDINVIEKDVKKNKRMVVNFEGLSCASCAAKIEKEVGKLNAINFASVDFVTQKLTIETEMGSNLTDLSMKIEEIAVKIEPDIKVSFDENIPDTFSKVNVNQKTELDDEGENIKQKVIKFILGGSIFAIGLIFKFPEPIELIIFLTSYLIVGGEVVLDRKSVV